MRYVDWSNGEYQYDWPLEIMTAVDEMQNSMTVQFAQTADYVGVGTILLTFQYKTAVWSGCSSWFILIYTQQAIASAVFAITFKEVKPIMSYETRQYAFCAQY